MQTVTEERPFYWACGKCHGAGLYRDDDRLVGDFSIVCPICGNRYYGDVGGRVRGLAPVITYYTIESAPLPFGASHFILERTANIVTGPARSGARTTEKKEESMGAKGLCANCKRVMSVVGEHCCFVCYHAGKGLEGEEKAAARAAVKARIESGEIHTWRRRPRKSAKVPSIAPSKREAPIGLPDATDLKALPRVKRIPNSLAIARTAPARVVEDDPVIAIDFAAGRDRKIYDALIAWAARLRRTPEQQILWMLQDVMEAEPGLLAEASER